MPRLVHERYGQWTYAGVCPNCKHTCRKAWADEILPAGHDQVCLNCGKSSVRPEPCPRCDAPMQLDGQGKYHCTNCNATGHFEDPFEDPFDF